LKIIDKPNYKQTKKVEIYIKTKGKLKKITFLGKWKCSSSNLQSKGKGFSRITNGSKRKIWQQNMHTYMESGIKFIIHWGFTSERKAL